MFTTDVLYLNFLVNDAAGRAAAMLAGAAVDEDPLVDTVRLLAQCHVDEPFRGSARIRTERVRDLRTVIAFEGHG